MHRKIEIERSFYERENKMSPEELEKKHQLESRLFEDFSGHGTPSPFEEDDFLALKINTNLTSITSKVFEPISRIKEQTITSNARIMPPYHKKFFDLGTNGVNPLLFPVEAMFVVLSKLHWNSSQKMNKNDQVLKICEHISENDATSIEDALMEIEGVEWASDHNWVAYETFLSGFLSSSGFS